ncbi:MULTISPECIES: phosphoenolpyruvate--protein phosphotransferase [unclassified Pseudomonas]|uniref:phosphoenolpyruvate--protein phosphotransferase n=1 Tax=unclassified Pseudomonas TaxID=196821 RepID=UPI001E40044F|nr:MULTISPECIES: phosphoenolpyruvate--protein phosphotransferase [unclassified Pseudomonas]MCE0915375.1 phosphoenolpyruvate--protein phosphotransferase [Pseudomonas sp. NMI760_13]MCP8634910.1 phosphoenolpyruvate--protein phosphotransferase [Pseudomonas sp. DVZ6]MDC0689740.1 phosphoenolpyruvate--protein phosphotransferase [Mitsuaria sp. RG]MDD7786243.1 phosphoenolpyruvate--protein phosphotransferase [Pseudomonas sp. DVZ24]
MPDNNKIILHAPLAGPQVPLDQVPDPVFSSGTLGDGVAIDPLNDVLHAPCAGEVVQLARTGHALTLRAANGAEVLLHIGVDTVQLQGRGFSPLVALGDQVTLGQPLVRFDMDLVAQHCVSLVTVMLVSNGPGFGLMRLETGTARLGAALLEVEATDSEADIRPVSHERASGHARVAHHGGLHARPAALLRQTAQGFQSHAVLRFAEREADLTSLVAVMGLGVGEGAEVELICTGPDSQAALQALIVAVQTASVGERHATHVPTSVATPTPNAEPGVLNGVCAAPGLALGPLARLDGISLPADSGDNDPAEQHQALNTALAEVRHAIDRDWRHLPRGQEDAAAILEAHLALLDDPALLGDARQHIAGGVAASHAWSRAIETQCQVLRSLGNPLLAERANDLYDLQQRVLRALLGETRQLRLPPAAIVVAHELTPSDLLLLARHDVAGLCMAAGGATSHVAILARARGLPCLVAVGEALLDLPAGTPLVLDADQGRLETQAAPQRLAEVHCHLQQRREIRQRQQAAAQQGARTRDGQLIEVAANVASAEEAAQALAQGADGIGLLRSEFLFIDRPTAPDEAEQRNAYQAVLDAMAERPVIIRTIDVGGDKQLDYLPLPAEANPVLGLRGIRLGQVRPELLDQQLRALLQVSPQRRCRIMLPMVTEVDELIAIRQRLDRLAAELGVTTRAELGVMIEVPAAALLAERLAEHADFFSIGTNDLSQYTLAMDRDHAGLAARVDALHPALLRLIGLTCQGAAKHGRWVGVCGALASDPLATPVLVGLGVAELSVSAPQIGEIKALVRQLDASACRRFSQGLLGLASAGAVRQACRDFAAQPNAQPAAPVALQQ